MIRTVVLGAAGRMGRTLVAEIQEDPELELAGALEAPQSPFIGVDAGALAGGDPCGVKITADIEEALKNADCLIDFTATIRAPPSASLRSICRSSSVSPVEPMTSETPFAAAIGA